MTTLENPVRGQYWPGSKTKRPFLAASTRILRTIVKS